MGYRLLDGSALGEIGPDRARDVVAWLISTGPAFFDAQFGDRDRALAALTAWLSREGSEFGLARSRIALDPSGTIAGGYFASKGLDLEKARRADMMAKLRTSDPEERRRYQAFVTDANTLAPVPPSESEYLSAIGVLPAHRGRGLGRFMIADWLARGRDRGTAVFQLNVVADNAVARRLYESFGFRTIGEGSMPGIELRSLTMRLDAGPAAGLGERSAGVAPSSAVPSTP